MAIIDPFHLSNPTRYSISNFSDGFSDSYYDPRLQHWVFINTKKNDLYEHLCHDKLVNNILYRGWPNKMFVASTFKNEDMFKNNETDFMKFLSHCFDIWQKESNFPEEICKFTTITVDKTLSIFRNSNVALYVEFNKFFQKHAAYTYAIFKFIRQAQYYFMKHGVKAMEIQSLDDLLSMTHQKESLYKMIFFYRHIRLYDKYNHEPKSAMFIAKSLINEGVQLLEREKQEATQLELE